MNTIFFDNEAELSVIGAMLQSIDAAKRHAELTEDDFANPDARAAFRAIRSLVLAGEPVDLVTVNSALAKNGADNTELLIRANDLVPAPSAIGSYIRAVRECSQRRKLDGVIRSIANAVGDGMREIPGVISDAQQALREFGFGRGGALLSMSDMIVKGYADIEKRASGGLKLIPTGIPDLDRSVGGIEPGEYWIIGARPSTGKSAAGMHIAQAAARKGYKVIVLSLEMTAEQYMQRIFSNAAYIDGQKLRSGQLTEADFNDLTDSMPKIAELPIFFAFPDALPDLRHVERLNMAMQRWKDEGRCDLLVIDYLQQMDTEKRCKSPYESVSEVTKALQRMTREYKIAIVALSQLSRPAPGRPLLPRLSDLRESGAIEQDADGVLLLHHCETAGDDGVWPEDVKNFDALTAGDKRYIAVIQAKGRQCSVGKFEMLFQPEIMRFTPIDRKGHVA